MYLYTFQKLSDFVPSHLESTTAECAYHHNHSPGSSLTRATLQHFSQVVPTPRQKRDISTFPRNDLRDFFGSPLGVLSAAFGSHDIPNLLQDTSPNAFLRASNDYDRGIFHHARSSSTAMRAARRYTQLLIKFRGTFATLLGDATGAVRVAIRKSYTLAFIVERQCTMFKTPSVDGREALYRIRVVNVDKFLTRVVQTRDIRTAEHLIAALSRTLLSETQSNSSLCSMIEAFANLSLNEVQTSSVTTTENTSIATRAPVLSVIERTLSTPGAFVTGISHAPEPNPTITVQNTQQISSKPLIFSEGNKMNQAPTTEDHLNSPQSPRDSPWSS